MRLRYPIVSVALAALGAYGCAAPTAPPSGPRFVDVAREAGITHVHEKPTLDAKLENIMPWMASVGAAVAAGDYDNDGRVDLYVTNSNKGRPNFLYRNNGDGTFTDLAGEAGLADVNDEGGVSTDCIWTDLDNDGWQDLYVVRWGTDRLYRNNGDGTFEEVTSARFTRPDGRPGTPLANGNSVVALDYDLDGRLDLYVGNYFREVDLWNLETTYIMHDSFENSRNAGRNFLYHQQPDGRFEEVAATLGVDDTGWTLSVGSADLNNDGWPDLYVANDFGPDKLFYNDGRGGFVDVSDRAIGRDTRKGMNVAFGDFNNDGWLDIYVTNITTLEYLREGNMLWRNNGPGADGLTRFMDVSSEAGTASGGWGWGAQFLDYDNDGDLDLFTVNGFVSAGEGSYWYDLASWTVLGVDPAEARNWPPMGDRSFSGYEPFRFFRNDGHESFVEQSKETGLASVRDGRGIACLDYDADGDIDLFVANQGQPPHLFRNDQTGGRHWLGVSLVGAPESGSNRDAIGARVSVVAGGERQIREREGGAGYSGQSEARLHFGLGDRRQVEFLEVRWPDGGVQYEESPAVDRTVTIRQDPASYATRSRVESGTPERREEAPDRARPERAPFDPQEVERMLRTVEEELRTGIMNRAMAYTYRSRAAEHDLHDRAIAFFSDRVRERPDEDWLRIELAVAYVDKLPTCGGVAAIVCKGTLARKSLDVLDELIARRPDEWVARYARGMNHLHWPRALGHSRAAVEDFTRCLELQSAADQAEYHGRIWVLLGDALAKDKDYTEARRVWGEGRSRFGDSPALAERLALSQDGELLEYVETERSLERPIDTDFSFLDRKP